MNKDLVYLALCASALIVVAYIGVGTGSQSQYLPGIYRMMDRNYLVNDWYTNTQDGLNVRTYFDLTVVGLNYFIGNLDVVFFTLTFLVSLGMIISLYYLSRFFFDRKTSALFALLVFYASDLLFIGNYNLFSYELSPNLISWLFVLVAFNLLLRKHNAPAFFSLGLAVLYQPVSGTLAFLIASFIYFRDNRNLKVLQVLPFAVSLLMYIPILMSPSVAGVAYITTYFRHPWHSIASEWPLIYYASTFLFLGAAYFARKIPQIGKDVAIASAAIIVAGFVFTEIIPIAFIAKAQFVRAFVFISLFCFLAIVADVVKNFQSMRIEGKIFSVFFLLSFIHLYAFVPFALLYIASKFTRYAHFVGMAAFAVGMGLAHFPLSYVFSMLIFAFAILSILYNEKLLPVVVVLAVGFLLINPLSARSISYDQPLCEYAGSNTPKDATFLVPPEGIDWRLCLNRSIVVDFESLPFSDRDTVEWYNRIINITGITRDKQSGYNLNLTVAYNSLSEDRIRQLAKQYNASYIVTQTNLTFERLYETNYILYRI